MTARACALGGALLNGRVGHLATGGPWWAEFCLAALALLTVCLRIVFPQDSPDKLAWWRDRRRTRLVRGFDVDEPATQHSANPERVDR
jgi:hypothetical protein